MSILLLTSIFGNLYFSFNSEILRYKKQELYKM